MTTKVPVSPNISIPFNVASVPAIGAYLTNLVQSLGSAMTGMSTAINGSIDDINAKQTAVVRTAFDLSTASGSLVISGVGFQPSLVIFLFGVQGGGGGSPWASVGVSNGSAMNMDIEFSSTNGANHQFHTTFAGLLSMDTAHTNSQAFTIASMNADGFTLTTTKTGSPTGTSQIAAICFR